MSNSELELFMGAGRELTNRANLPSRDDKVQRQEEFSLNGVTTLVLGEMLAQVAILPMPRLQTIRLLCFDGDREMLNAVRGEVRGGKLTLEGTLPYKAGSPQRGHGNVYGGNVFGRNTVISGGAFISGGSVHIGNGNIISGDFIGGNGEETLIIGGREVDLNRSFQMVLIVPQTLNLKVDRFVGSIGITDELLGELNYSPSFKSYLYAPHGLGALAGDLSGSGYLEVGHVRGETELDISGSADAIFGELQGTAVLEISGSGKIRCRSAAATARASVSGSGKITFECGTTPSLRASVSGSGKVAHYGTITGNARLSVSGSGKIEAPRVLGEVNPSVTGSGKVIANGQTYRPRW